MLSIQIEQSKTDPFRQGVTIFLGKIETLLCLVASPITYLALRVPGQGPLFYFQDSHPWMCQRLVAAVRTSLTEIGLKPNQYLGHSFCIGAATTAAACEVPVSTIKTLECWRAKQTSYMCDCRGTNWWTYINRTLAHGKI